MPLRSILAGVGILFLTVTAAAQSVQPTDLHSRALNAGWEVRSLNAAGHQETQAWHPATVPGVVTLDLLHAGLIQDPFFRDNEKSLQWIGLSDWEYRTTFTVSASEHSRKHQELVFEGLDTFADVYVNGKPLLSANNMFRAWRIDAAPALRTGKNELRVVFHSAITEMMPKVKAMAVKIPTVGQVQAISEEGIATDPYVRKAPYSYGWDWGPRFVNEGIWKAVHLDTWDNLRIERLHIAQNKITADNAALEADLAAIADHDEVAEMTVVAHLISGSGAATTTLHRTVHLTAGLNQVKLPFDLPHPALWFPVGYGKPSRYEFTASLIGKGFSVHTTTRTGLRHVELQRTPDAIGESFTFVLNGKPVFAKGADVIPFDSFAPRVTEAQHRQILQSAVDAHMNMVREWGGGYYESDDFYDIADELGLMVWQEFMFGGAQIPGDDQVPGFRENVQREAEQQVDRLRDHPSIVLWCGNNEVETGWYHWGDRVNFRKNLEKDAAIKVWQDYLLVMDNVLQSVVATHTPDIPYTPSSPHSSYDQLPDIQTAGDMHYWQVWGVNAPISEYNKITPRFMSEYGFQSFPEMATIRAFAQPADMQLTSPVMLAHQKNDGGNERIKKYMDAEYPKPKDFASFVYLSQVQQAEAIQVAADHLRTSRPRTMGSLYWQLNDCWPVASWSSIDYFGRWKALQFYAKRFYADVEVVPYFHDGSLDTSVVNDLDHAIEASLKMTVMDFAGNVQNATTRSYTIPAASAKEVSRLNETALLNHHSADNTLVSVELSVDGKVVSERNVYFTHVKDLKLPEPVITHRWIEKNGELSLVLSSSKLARNVWVTFGDANVQLSDNSFDLLPGRPKTIAIHTPSSREKLERTLSMFDLHQAF
ncbi:MAG: glycoside hydrolase family 2 TIM barrel-domain containing protein [Acidobacteriaceae bacterium]|nr:glycoside hydrolase family 2 TIM barrel-domain containing protein [Acidobacteriaceae bacterium]